MRDQACATRKQRHDYGVSRTWMAEHLDCKQRTTDRTNHGVNSVPDRIDPRNLVGEEFQEIENACDGDDPGVTEDVEGLVLRRQRDPMKVNGQPGNEDRQVKIDPRKRGKTEGDSKQIKPLHGENIRGGDLLSRASFEVARASG